MADALRAKMAPRTCQRRRVPRQKALRIVKRVAKHGGSRVVTFERIPGIGNGASRAREGVWGRLPGRVGRRQNVARGATGVSATRRRAATVGAPTLPLRRCCGWIVSVRVFGVFDGRGGGGFVEMRWGCSLRCRWCF